MLGQCQKKCNNVIESHLYRYLAIIYEFCNILPGDLTIVFTFTEALGIFFKKKLIPFVLDLESDFSSKKEEDLESDIFKAILFA